MGIPFNELNQAFDLGFKPLPWGDEGYVPTTMQAVGAGKVQSPKSKVQSRAVEIDPFGRLAAALKGGGVNAHRRAEGSSLEGGQ